MPDQTDLQIMTILLSMEKLLKDILKDEKLIDSPKQNKTLSETPKKKNSLKKGYGVYKQGTRFTTRYYDHYIGRFDTEEEAIKAIENYIQNDLK